MTPGDPALILPVAPSDEDVPDYVRDLERTAA